MKECKEIKKIMVDCLSGELPGCDTNSRETIAAMENHLRTCNQCQREYRVLQDIYRESNQINEEAEALMQTIDWEENAQKVSRSIRFKRPHRTWNLFFQPFNWKLAAPVLTGVFILGIWLGYILFYKALHIPSLPGKPLETRATLARLETTLARREIKGYFKQTQLLLMDLMRQCDDYGIAAWPTQENRQQVRTLLNKNRYFNHDLTNPQLLSTRQLLKKIEWLLYEMLTLDEETSCDHLHRLREYIRQERLLLKMRLVGKDISFSEV